MFRIKCMPAKQSSFFFKTKFLYETLAQYNQKMKATMFKIIKSTTINPKHLSETWIK